MAQRITITIPDELFERLSEVKDGFNISGVCQAAIEDEVDRQEVLQKETKTVSHVIRRLKAEKKELNKVYVRDGYKAGLEDAKEMHYGDLRYFAKVHEEYVNESGMYAWDTQIVLDSAFYKEWLMARVQGLEQKDEHFDADSYLEGWLKGMIKFWNEVKDKL